MDIVYLTLVEDIKEKSKEGLIEWAPNSFGRSYKAKLGSGAITITYLDPDDESNQVNPDTPILILSFLNYRGDVFNSIYCYRKEDENYNNLMSIYNSAHNNYMKINDTLNNRK